MQTILNRFILSAYIFMLVLADCSSGGTTFLKKLPVVGKPTS